MTATHLYSPLCYPLQPCAERVHLVEETLKNLCSVPQCSNEAALVCQLLILKSSPLETSITCELYCLHTWEDSGCFPISPPSLLSSSQSVLCSGLLPHRETARCDKPPPAMPHHACRTRSLAPSCVPPFLSQPSRPQGTGGQFPS